MDEEQGYVKWFNDSKGFGFIKPKDGGEDIFVHFSSISGSGFRSLTEGQLVAYSAVEGDKGWQAQSVRILMGEEALS